MRNGQLRAIEPGPHIGIVATSQSFVPHGVHIVHERRQLWPQRLRHILIQLDLHAAAAGKGGTGKSSPAAAAANAMTARNPSGVTVGKSASNSASVAPSARLASKVLTGTRVPLTTSAPPHRPVRRSKYSA